LSSKLWLLLTSCVTWSKLVPLSAAKVLHLWKGKSVTGRINELKHIRVHKRIYAGHCEGLIKF
jgi:hypothetical protein